MFKAKEEEAQHQFDKIAEIKQQLNQFKDQLGITKDVKYAQPLATTSFMVRKQTQQPKAKKSLVESLISSTFRQKTKEPL